MFSNADVLGECGNCWGNLIADVDRKVVEFGNYPILFWNFNLNVLKLRV